MFLTALVTLELSGWGTGVGVGGVGVGGDTSFTSLNLILASPTSSIYFS